jgi:hypothetical protein
MTASTRAPRARVWKLAGPCQEASRPSSQSKPVADKILFNQHRTSKPDDLFHSHTGARTPRDDYLFSKNFVTALPAPAAANCAYDTPSPHSSPEGVLFYFSEAWLG